MAQFTFEAPAPGSRYSSSDRHMPPPSDPPAGPGWYESSHELRQGLDVREDPRYVASGPGWPVPPSDM